MVNSATTTESPAITAAADSSVVLVVAASESIAKRIESHLRNRGHAIRTAWVTDVEDVSESLRRGAPDLVLCGASSPETPCKDVLALCQRLAPELPVLALYQRGETQQRLTAMSQGARDCVACDDENDLRHLELVLLRELAVHRKARDLNLTRKRLQDFESRHQQLLSGTNDAVAHLQEGILAHLNPAFAQLLGYDDPEPLNGQPLMDLVAPEFQSKVKEQLRLLARGKTDNRILDGALLHRDGAAIPIHARLTVSEVDGEQLIEMLIRAEARAPAALAASPVTTPNTDRLAFFDALGASLQTAAAQQRQGVALLLAVDGFAALEQQLGLHDSEQAILQLRDWLTTRLPSGDQLFRFSAHELAVVRSSADLGSLQAWMDSLSAEAAQQIFSTAGHEAQLSLSVAAYPFNGSETALTLVTELATAARQLASRGARQILILGATAQSSQHEREDARKAELVRKALTDNRLKLAYQSIMSLEGDPRQHFDVFVRLIDESGHELHAAEFLGAAEKSQQMRLVDRWVTAQALKVQSKRGGADEPTSLFIKISEETLKDSEDFVVWLRELIQNRPLKPGELVFQFQELALQNHIRKAKLVTRALIDLGAEVAIEHFGIGSNSAQMIEHLPMQFLKFHQSFTKNFNDRDSLQRMSALAELAKQRKIKVIVSHIEDANAMARLWQMGVNFIQGYHVQEPEVVMLAADRR